MKWSAFIKRIVSWQDFFPGIPGKLPIFPGFNSREIAAGFPGKIILLKSDFFTEIYRKDAFCSPISVQKLIGQSVAKEKGDHFDKFKTYGWVPGTW